MFGSYHRFFEDVSSNIRGRSFMHARCISLYECVRVLPARRWPHVGGFQTNRRPPCQGGLHGLLAIAARGAIADRDPGGRAWSARLGIVIGTVR